MKGFYVFAFGLVCFVAGYAVSTATRNHVTGQTVVSFNNDKPEVFFESSGIDPVEVERLQKLNDELRKALANNVHPVSMPVSTTYQDLVKKIDKLPENLIRKNLASILDDEYLKQIDDIRGFSKRLLEAALEENPVKQSDVIASIEFSTSPVYGSNLLGSGVNVGQYDKIFAFITVSEPLSKAFVKWQNAETGELLLFRSVRLNTANGFDFVSTRPGSGWQSGQYQVSVFLADKELTPIGGGSYVIAGITEQPGGAKAVNESIVQDMINSGQAIRKK